MTRPSPPIPPQPLPQTRGFVDLTDKVVGRLVVMSYGGRGADGCARWNCRCVCGKKVAVLGHRLRAEKTLSCGCLHSEGVRARKTRHGGAARTGQHPLYETWSALKGRCLTKSNKRYRLYGARGITVCNRWLAGEEGKTGFECFVSDMGPKPSPKHSIDRRDNEGPYAPWNCRWATQSQQVRNSRPYLKRMTAQALGGKLFASRAGIEQ